MTTSVMIMAGGTGGHVFPALAVACALRDLGHEVSWLGTERGIEARVVPEAGIEIDWLSVSGLRGKGLKSLLLAPFMLLKACWQAFSILRQRKPDVVLGLGGFVAGPGGLMARLRGLPLVIHEQNRVPGTTNRLLSMIATKVLEAFPDSFDKEKQAICTGNPLRKEIEALALTSAKTDGETNKLHLLVLGGSLGAAILNETVPAALDKLSNRENIEVRHQSGERTIDQARKAYDKVNIDATICPFIEEMAEAYRWADLVICRAGAMTVSELSAAALPGIFVPLPHAIDDHQSANARYLSNAGAAIIIPQRELSAQNLADKLGELMTNPARLVEMGKQAACMAKVDATSRVAEICLEEAAL